MASFSELLTKIAKNERLTPQEMDELKRFGTDTQMRNSFVAGNTTAENTLNIKLPFVPIYSEVLQKDTAEININIPQDYNHILFMCSGRGTYAVSTMVVIRALFNGDTTANNYGISSFNIYDSSLIGEGTSSLHSAAEFSFFARMAGALNAANAAAASFIVLTNYRSSYYKQAIGIHGMQDADYRSVQVSSMGWNSTESISSIKLYPESGSMAAGSSVTMYGIL